MLNIQLDVRANRTREGKDVAEVDGQPKLTAVLVWAGQRYEFGSSLPRRPHPPGRLHTSITSDVLRGCVLRDGHTGNNVGARLNSTMGILRQLPRRSTLTTVCQAANTLTTSMARLRTSSTKVRGHPRSTQLSQNAAALAATANGVLCRVAVTCTSR